MMENGMSSEDSRESGTGTVIAGIVAPVFAAG